MTGIAVRVQVEGRWQSVEIETLSDAALETFCAAESPPRLVQWAAALAGWIRDHVTAQAD